MAVRILNFEKALLAFVLLNAGISFSYCQQESKSFETICYCKTKGQSPDNIVLLDNNYQLLKTLTVPQTTATLSKNISVNDSQLQLLKQWFLIKENDDSLETAIPVLDSLQTMVLRKISHKYADEMTTAIAGDVKQLTQYLSSTGCTKNAYSILFSYILDGKVWPALEASQLINKRNFPGSNNLWAGEFWILDKKRDFNCGTNTMKDNGFAFYVNWSNGVIKKMWDFFGNWTAFGKLFTDFEERQKVLNDTAKSVFAKYEIFNSAGEFTVPVIKEDGNGPFSVISKNITDKVTGFLRQQIQRDELKRFSFRDDKQLMVILYHEILWDMMDLLSEKGIITKPLFFSDPQTAAAKDAADLIFLAVPGK